MGYENNEVLLAEQVQHISTFFMKTDNECSVQRGRICSKKDIIR